MRYDSASTTSTAAPPSVRHEKRAPRPVSASSPKSHRKVPSTINTAIGQVSQMLLYTTYTVSRVTYEEEYRACK